MNATTVGGAPAPDGEGPAPAQSGVSGGSALAIATAISGTLLPPILLVAAGHTLAWRDTARLLGPWRTAIEADLRALRLPLWAPHEALGMPLLAQVMHGVLHPVSLVAASLAPGAPMDLQIVLHLALAAAGAWILARVLGASPWAAAVAGLAYGLSGYVLGMSCVLTYLAGAGTAPWGVAALRLAGRGRRLGVAWAAAAVAALALAGDPQWLIVATALGLVLAFEQGSWRGLARGAAGAALGALVAGVQLVPALAYLPETSRAAALEPSERALWALPPWRIPELVLPGLFNGIPGSGASRIFRELGGEVGRHTTSFVPSIFVGLVVLFLALAGLRSSRPARWLGGSVLVSLWLALGVNAGADQLLRWIPVWGAFRYSEKLVGPAVLCISALAALGADTVASGVRGPRRAIALAAGAVAVPLLLAWPAGGALLGTLVTAATVPELRHRTLVGAGHAAVAAALLAAVVIAARRGRRAGLRAAAGAVLVESAAAAAFALHAGAPGIVERDPLRALRGDGEVVRVTTPVPNPPIVGHEDLDAADRLAAFQSRIAAAPYGAASGIDQLDCYSGFASLRFDRVSASFERDLGPRSWEAWRRLGLTHVVVPRVLLAEQVASASASLEGGTKVLEDRSWGFSAWRVPGRPWASFGTGVVTVAGPEDAYSAFVAHVAAGDPDVVLEGPAPGGTAAGRVLAVERGGGRVRIEAEADGEALLVVNDAYWPGWEARLDGGAVPMTRADVLVRAMPFPKGRHVVEMRYRPPEVRWGLLATAAGLTCVTILCVLPALRERRRRIAANGNERP